MRQDGRFWASLVVPPIATGAGGSEAVRAIFLRFDRQAQRLRSILRLLLVAVMAMAVWAGTSRTEWPTQFAVVGVYGMLALIAAWMLVRHPQRARKLRALEPMVPVDVAAICVLQFLSTGSYLVLAELTASRSRLLADVMTSEERERRRIAEALHDGALQTVLAAKQDLREVMRSNPLADGVVRASELLGDVSH